MVKWLNIKGITWKYETLNKAQEELLLNLLKIRARFFGSLSLGFLLIFIVTLIRFTARERRLKTTLYALPYFKEYSTGIVFLLYVITIIYLYKYTVKPIKKDLQSGQLITFYVTVTSKHYYEYADKYFVFSDVRPYHQIPTSALVYSQIRVGDSFPIVIAPYSKHRFDEFGKYEYIT